MKTTYNNIILGFLILLMFSCYKDKSNTTFEKLDKFNIDGIKDKYDNILAFSTLKIEPIIVSEKKDRNFEYFWICYDITKNEQLDTISKEKNLKYHVNLGPGTYDIMFSVKNTKTGNFAFKKTQIIVETKTTSGWYILKDKEGFTQLDLFNEIGTMIDMGRILKGNAVQIAYTKKFNYFDPKTGKRDKITTCIIPMSSNDMSVIRLSDFKELSKFNELFYSAPTTVKPYFWIETSETEYLEGRAYFVNNNKIHQIDRYNPYNPGKFGPSLKIENNDNYSLSKHFVFPKNINPFSVVNNLLVFDEIQSTFYFLSENKIKSFKEEGKNSSQTYYPNKNLNSDLLYMGCKQGPNESGSRVIALLKIRSGLHKNKLILTHLDMDLTTGGGFPYYSSYGTNDSEEEGVNPVYKMDTLSTTLKLATAELYTINKEYDILYYTKDNKISYYDFATKQEKEIKSLASGEKITYIHHYYKYDGWDGVLMSKLVVASHDNENYKVYLFDLLAGGIPQSNPKIMKGKGKVADVLYVKEMDFYNNRR
jgi:hypothetical protein